MVILLPTILHLVNDWTRLASSNKAKIYDQIDSSFYILRLRRGRHLGN